jgi:non-homologous end joining protein Ku
MPPRANWKGYLRLSLVSCPIALYPASSLSEKVSFNRINRKTGNRLKQPARRSPVRTSRAAMRSVKDGTSSLRMMN